MNDDYEDDDTAQRPMMTMEQFRTDYDWGGSFEHQLGAVYEAHTKPDPVPGFAGPTAWSLDDVAEVLASSEGENDGADWLALLRLTDGRFVFMSAGCDYTGWDCRASGRSWIGATAESVMRLSVNDADRERLGLAA